MTIYIYIYIYWQHFFIDIYSIEHNRHFLSTYFFVNSFELLYRSYDIWRELVDKPSVISYFPSTFCQTLGHHQGKMYYKSDVTFVCRLLLCKFFSINVSSLFFIIKGFWTGLLFSSLLLFPQRFGWYVLRPSSGVCRTWEPSQNFDLRPLLNPRGVACSDSISHNRVQVLSIPVLLLACSQDWTCNLQMIVSLKA